MSENSRKLLKDKKGDPYSKSFLDRNYYKIQPDPEHKIAKRERLNSATSAGRAQTH